jgi:hypothetical protein
MRKVKNRSMVSIQIYQEQQEDRIEELTRELNLIYYASEAAEKMHFSGIGEFHGAVKRAMEICSYSGLPLRMNFKQIYKCSPNGVTYDWKLSALGFQLVCLNGSSENPFTARMQINLLRGMALNL